MSSGRSSKRKGAKGEREACEILSQALGFEIKRKLGAARSGGVDSEDLPGWAIEIKRVEKAHIQSWWRQAIEQAAEIGRKPMLMYRASFEPWKIMVRLYDLSPQVYKDHRSETTVISVEAFAVLWHATKKVSDTPL